ncbi:ribonuclease P protein component [Patescibacteria group bacterium]|nr:ribonuclease P protein component [Patescibacteria group bacterium]MBU4030738.1 ribonuclease P protein component [Patescibacteria group bacterium]MBU4082708.1 ribonuclease P protein component [Patescibacteria group bacterium]MCG2809314.1 ribonuclease P protein component [Candidatus Portnoybacteria bacterium]
MLPKEHKLKKKNDFKAVFNNGRYCQKSFIKLKFAKNNLQKNRFGFIVGLKVSKKAVERNQIKRRLEEITRLIFNELKQGFDVVVMVDPVIKEKIYSEIKEELVGLYKKVIWK